MNDEIARLNQEIEEIDYGILKLMVSMHDKKHIEKLYRACGEVLND